MYIPKRYGGSGDDVSTSVAVSSSSSSVYVAGYTTSSTLYMTSYTSSSSDDRLSNDLEVKSNREESSNDKDIFVAKLSTSGSVSWSKR